MLPACNILSLLLLQENISCHGRKISVDLTSSVIVAVASVQLCNMLKTAELLIVKTIDSIIYYLDK